jgi:hypothetical protein
MNAEMEMIRPVSIVIANEVKQSHEIATLSRWAGLLAMTAFSASFRDCSTCLREAPSWGTKAGTSIFGFRVL